MSQLTNDKGWRIGASLRDRIAGLVLLTVSLVWIFFVYRTIDPGQGPEAGARAFPMFFGVALAVLSLLLMAQARNADADSEDDPPLPSLGIEVWFVGVSIGLTLVYGALLERLGFVLSSMLFVAAVMTMLLRIRRPVFVLAMSVGLSLGSYVIFGKLLGTYLPPGSWITIQF
jgi:putative tricarboxylic transport membrane protein